MGERGLSGVSHETLANNRVRRPRRSMRKGFVNAHRHSAAHWRAERTGDDVITDVSATVSTHAHLTATGPEPTAVVRNNKARNKLLCTLILTPTPPRLRFTDNTPRERACVCVCDALHICVRMRETRCNIVSQNVRIGNNARDN